MSRWKRQQVGGSGPATDGSPWDANAAMSSASSASDYQAICAGRNAGEPDQRSSWALPHHKRPGAAANAAGVRAARSRFGQTEGLTNSAAARRHIFEAHSLPSENEAEAASGITFGDEAAETVAASFRADPEKRTISGLLVPWGKVARSGFAKWKFGRGSLRYFSESRVKLNSNHDRKQAIGVAVRLQDVALGLDGTFKIARGEEGDRALSLAEDGVLDGFSIELDFEDGDGWEPDPSDESVRLVKRGRLAGVALTGFPAFDDARVDRVAAARQEGTTMAEDLSKPQEVKAENDPAEQFEQAMTGLAERVAKSQEETMKELAQDVGESITSGFRAALENMHDPQGPETVRAARFSTLKEPPIYRFDGSGHSLVRDAWSAARNEDPDALDRVRKFRAQSEDTAQLAHSLINFAPQTTSTASQIIPPGYRPDLYVPDLFRERPLVRLGSQGTISNATPFTVPVFTSVTTGSADHVEGTNPSDGSLAFGTKTVTPGAISGRIVLSRELVDSSNPAIDQIAFAEMQESYARQTEAKVYTLLNGANGAGGTITAGFVPSGAQAVTTAGGTDNQTLVKSVRKAITDYQFARFARITGAAMGQGATSRLAQAVDTTQRLLVPWVGASNAQGTGDANEGSWVLDGIRFNPAWAMTGTAAGDSQIFLINSRDLWVWESPLLTFRFEEKQGPANIELNIFGYFATHLLRPVGLSGIRIT
jgi:HK97 family phage prohead protease